MSLLGKILELSYDSVEATKTSALKTYYRSVRFIKDAGTVNPEAESYETNVLLNGKCIDPETRCLYVFYIDTYYSAAWIIEINLDSRVQTVVYYDKTNAIGFDANFKIYKASVVHGKLVWTDNKNPIYQMDISRAKKSFYYQIGYGAYPNTEEWASLTSYGLDQVVSAGNYFYKSTIAGNVGADPRTDDGTLWTKLCMIEDAYYSMNIENFYFEAVPPKLPPTVIYVSDDTRRINSLRQTMFQIAYRYVYMDWRKSTFSPASIVPVPQAEEETATGLANEQASLNNGLKITLNLGGEEVRAVEIVARSSDDPSKWYLIETINKFDEEERAGEISVVENTPYTTLTITIPAPIVTSSGISIPDNYINLVMSVQPPTVDNHYIVLSDTELEWQSYEYGLPDWKDITITLVGGNAILNNVYSWIHIERGVLIINDGDIITGAAVYTIYVDFNPGTVRTGYIVIGDIFYGNTAIITITQHGLLD